MYSHYVYVAPFVNVPNFLDFCFVSFVLFTSVHFSFGSFYSHFPKLTGESSLSSHIFSVAMSPPAKEFHISVLLFFYFLHFPLSSLYFHLCLYYLSTCSCILSTISFSVLSTLIKITLCFWSDNSNISATSELCSFAYAVSSNCVL